MSVPAVLAVLAVAVVIGAIILADKIASFRAHRSHDRRRRTDHQNAAAPSTSDADDERAMLAVARFRIPPTEGVDADAAAQAVVDALVSSARDTDTVTHYGPGDYLVTLPGATPYDGLNAAERLRNDVVSAVAEVTDVRVTIGLAENDDAAFEPDAVVPESDAVFGDRATAEPQS